MDVNHINPFISTADTVMMQFLGSKLDQSKPHIKKTPFNAMAYDECDDKIKMSAVCEMCNMISGASLQHFHKLRVKH